MTHSRSSKSRRCYAEKILENVRLEILPFLENYYRDQYFPRARMRFIRTLEELVDRPPGKLLDVGCRPGFLSLAAKRMGYEVYGVDFMTSKINFLENSFGIQLTQHNIEVSDLPFEDSTFDVVLFTDVIEHLSISVSFPLSETFRVLKKNGILLLSTPNVLSLINTLKISLFRENIYAGINTFYKGPVFVDGQPIFDRHNRLFSLNEVTDLLRFIGYKVEKVVFFNEEPLTQRRVVKWVLFPGLSILSRVVPSFSGHFLVRSRKREHSGH